MTSKKEKQGSKFPGFDTRAVHSGDALDYNAGAVVPPIYQSVTFHFPAELSEAREKGTVHLYTRLGNPTLTNAARTVANLEGAEKGEVFSSGMAAMSSVLLSSLRAGDEVVALEDLYGNTIVALRDLLPRMGIAVKWVSGNDPSAVLGAMSEKTKLLILESPTNPTLRVHDIRTWAKAARSVNALLLVDNTFATPVNQNPLELGADIVMHAATKYLSGHSDIVAGALAGSGASMTKVTEFATTLGGTLDPIAAFLLSRGMKTLGVRMKKHNENAKAIATEFARHPRIEAVHYPGSHSSEEEKIAMSQMRGRSGMVSLVIAGGLPAARSFMSSLTLIHPASSLGGVESLVSLPVETSHRQLTKEDRDRRGIADGLARISVGIEDASDIISDIRAALSKI